MNKLKLTLSIFALTISQITMADYMARIPLEVANGGSLPNGSIIFKNPINPIDPIIPVPVEEILTLDCGITDFSEECDRRLNAWEQFAIDKGINHGYSTYGDWQNLHWGSVPFQNWKELTELPNDPYPLLVVNRISFFSNKLTSINGLRNITNAGLLNFDQNMLTNVDSLMSLTSVGELNLDRNQLENINGLVNLKNVNTLLDLSNNKLSNVEGLIGLSNITGGISLYNNQLTNLNGLINLESVGSLNLSQNNNLTDISGLSNLRLVSGNFHLHTSAPLINIEGLKNITVLGNIRIDIHKNYTNNFKLNGIKLAADTLFCQNDPLKFKGDYTKKDFCNLP